MSNGQLKPDNVQIARNPFNTGLDNSQPGSPFAVQEPCVPVPRANGAFHRFHQLRPPPFNGPGAWAEDADLPRRGEKPGCTN